MTKEEIILKIQKAYQGVLLEGGVGLWEGQAIDDYDVGVNRAQAREKDELYNWELISKEDLNYCESSLSFFDPRGIKFHLPAYLILELNKESESAVGIIFKLTNSNYEMFELLDKPQKNVVKEFLYYILQDKNYWYEKEEIENSLFVFWDDDYQDKNPEPTDSSNTAR